LDLSKEQQISLKEHSCKDGDYVHNMLKSNDSYYCSQTGNVKNDWIILSINDNNKYYPTKLQLRGFKNNTSSPKRFSLKIGSTDLDEWINLNEEILTASKEHDELQTFNCSIVNNMKNDEIISKWKKIKSKQYHQFKLEILDNYGAPYIEIAEFKIFGVKI